MKLDGREEYSFDFTLPEGGAHIGNSSVRRDGGLTDADHAFRSRLYLAVGRSTVAGGRIEAAMKRIILFFRDESPKYSLVDETWSGLEKALKKILDLPTEAPDRTKILASLREDLAWAESKKLKERRDDLVHGQIWDYVMPMVVISRVKRKEDGSSYHFLIEDIERISENLTEFADRLEYLLHGKWHEVLLPRSPQVPGYSAFMSNPNKS